MLTQTKAQIIDQADIDQVERAIISCYELENGVNLYGILPKASKSLEYLKAVEKARTWARSKKNFRVLAAIGLLSTVK